MTFFTFGKAGRLTKTDPDDLTAIPPFLRRTGMPKPADMFATKRHPGAALKTVESVKVYKERDKKRADRDARRNERLWTEQRRRVAKAQKRADQEKVLSSIGDGAETWGQLVAGTALEAPALRSALRALVKKGMVGKLSKRRYGLTGLPKVMLK